METVKGVALEAKQLDTFYRSFAFIAPLSKNTEVHVASYVSLTSTFDTKVL